MQKETKTWKDDKLGGFWIKKTKEDRMYLSGVVNIKMSDGSMKKVPICIYKNDFKDGNKPDFNAYQMDVL